jgi:hypothetical protein
MPDLNLSSASRPSALGRQVSGLGHARTLHSANRRALRHLGWPSDSTRDPHGRMLRQLRIQLGMDPSLLATNACLSLSQLYELEDGGDSRFYSESLRRQAGRRVARLLGADWDRMAQEIKSSVQVSNVLPLQRSALQAVQHSSFSERIVGSPPLPPAASVASASASEQMADSLTCTSFSDTASIPVCLSAPASEPLMKSPSPLPAPAEATVVHANDWPAWWAVLMVIGVGIGAGYAFAIYSPYRLYWPW